MSDQTPDPSVPSAAPAGWYPDPQNPGQQRYWDGSAWGAAAPAAPSTPPAPAAAPVTGPITSTNAIIGLVLAIVSWVVCPIIAAIVALVLAHSSSKEIAASDGRVGGAGLNTATRIIAWINIGISLLSGLVIAALVGFGVLFATNIASTLDPAMNTRTGLNDGEYIIDPSTRVNINSECSYGGSTFTPEGDEIQYTAVYGKGPVQCPDLVEVSAVRIEVVAGVARIVEVE